MPSPLLPTPRPPLESQSPLPSERASRGPRQPPPGPRARALTDPPLPLRSLSPPAQVYSIPMLLVIGWRGEPGKKDEPQHQVQGRVMPHMLREMSIPYEVLPDYDEGIDAAVANAYA